MSFVKFVQPYTSFLHQTTTSICSLPGPARLSYTSFLHQTTTNRRSKPSSTDCLILLFYIKPQRLHPARPWRQHCLILLFYIKPQQPLIQLSYKSIVLYFFSPSNHNEHGIIMCVYQLSYTSFLHQTTTGILIIRLILNCLILLFYIKPQHQRPRYLVRKDCLILLFYIKPQLRRSRWCLNVHCLILLFFIKPQRIVYYSLILKHLRN